MYQLSSYSQPPNNANSGSSSNSPARGHQRRPSKLPGERPDVLVAKAKAADDTLRHLTRFYSQVENSAQIPYFLPSLSVLAHAAFGRLTGVPPTTAKTWADAMVLAYLDDAEEKTFHSEQEILDNPPLPHNPTSETTVNVLRRLLQEAEAQHDKTTAGAFRPRPCGYVFKRGDIAWNCRTCQTDSTCVICDNCFRHSDHVGHEVFFHRTTPGGCCDCGDAEAWKLEGCCDAHRPISSQVVEVTADDPDEAPRMAARGRQQGIETLTNAPTALPPKLAAALGAVIGAAVHCLVQAVDGAGIGADPVQWKLRWMDEASRIWNAAAKNEDYALTAADTPKPPGSVVTPSSFLGADPLNPLPHNYRLQLRLHNDDVHTFDEVIDALHEPRQARRAQTNPDDPQNQSLVTMREAANEMTHHVDADGQVTVKNYSTFHAAVQGFRRLKSRGLHCAVVSTAQADMEHRARALSSWLSEISAAHPAAAVLVVHALVQVGRPQDLAGIAVWQEPRTIPPWACPCPLRTNEDCRRRFGQFPPHLSSSYLTSEEAEILHETALRINPQQFIQMTGADLAFYSGVPYRLPPERYRKSPHALWGTLPSLYTDPIPLTSKHPLLHRLATGQKALEAFLIKNTLTEVVYVVDTDLRKQQEADRITSSMFPHRLPGLHLISGMGTVRAKDLTQASPPQPDPMRLRHLLAMSSFRAPMSPIILLLLLDPYPTKQLRGAVHALFLSLLTDARFKCRFAAALGVAYRPLSTLFCAGVGTEADTPLGFTVQIFTAGSLVRALGNAPSVEKLLLPDDEEQSTEAESSIGVFTMPIALTVVRCIHTNLLGATKEVHMILNNTATGNDDDSDDNIFPSANDALLPSLTYVAGEHPLITPLPAAPDDGFLDSRSTRHKRLPHLLRDLEYVIETPGTAMRLLLPNLFPSYLGPSLSFRGEEIMNFATVWSRLLRLAQGMDPQKRKISGGHVEYEQNRWLEAFGLSLNFAGTRDALAESPTNSSSAALAPVSEDGSHLVSIREAMGNILAAILREMKLWLYREGMLETGLPMPPGGIHGASDLSQIEALQRSTLHVSASQLPSSLDTQTSPMSNVSTVALSCATTVKMTEAQLDLIESALKIEGNQRQYKQIYSGNSPKQGISSGAVMGDWLRVPHSPLAGDSLSFHLPLHRAFAKSIRSICSVVVPEMIRNNDARSWWKLPVLDVEVEDPEGTFPQHPLVPLIRPILRSSNCRVVWSAGPDCSQQEAQRRRSRARNVSANIAVAKIIHSLADHPMRCLAAAQQIERHLWARNGSSTAGMALNYSNAPLCRSFRDLDLNLVQLSAAGMSVGLGASRVFALLISRFSMDGYLCDPERRTGGGSTGAYSTGLGAWINPPRLNDPEHATVLSESFFSTLCVLVSELPPPPPMSPSDEEFLRQSIRRELIHALAAEPRSHSSAMAAASCAVGRRDESDGSAGTSGGGGLFRDVFASVLKEVGKQKVQGSRATSGPASFELSPDCCDEYDPTFFHLRRQEHQHAMDVVATLRKQKLLKGKNDGQIPEAYCFPLVCPPPKAHPRFLPCRLMLHLAPMDAAIRRSLLFALFAGSWLPPAEPTPKIVDIEGGTMDQSDISASGISVSTTASGDIPVTTFSRRAYQGGASSTNPFQKRGSIGENDPPSFSAEVVASSSVSFLEVLQLLTLQVHTLEECASLHRMQPDIDDEAKSISASLSINSYLGRLVRVPDSLEDVWALKPYPEGPLKSKGSGEKRGSTLGLLIALYEHRADHGAGADNGSSDQGSEGHGGARALAASGLKWLLRFVNVLVDGAPSVAIAVKCATTGTPINKLSASSGSTSADSGLTIWTIDETVRRTISGMLANLADLWPNPVDESSDKKDKADEKKKERGKAAQQKMLEMMRKKQSAFVASMGPDDEKNNAKGANAEEAELCIICRCDDADGENNGPLGFLGHVQRSRVSQMRACSEAISKAKEGVETFSLFQRYRVIGHMGCQVRETEAMDSRPLLCLPRGSIVSVLNSTISDNYDILSRRVLVKHVSETTGVVTEGWASVQSSQGYVILSPLVSVCYENARWGSTRPIVKQCGHAAHLRCVETHTLSLHQRAAGEQPYDGRFAANIDDGEFLCPLCKQLSNILIPRDGCVRKEEPNAGITKPTSTVASIFEEQSLRNLLTQGTIVRSADVETISDMGKKALADFGAHLLQAMDVPWERTMGGRKRKLRRWHPAIQRWDYEEGDESISSQGGSPSVKSVLRLLRQQHIAWAAVGHSAAAAEASVRGLEEVLPFGSFSKTDDPWPSYSDAKDSDPMVLELTRTMSGASGLLEVLIMEISKQLTGSEATPSDDEVSIIGNCLADIVTGRGWTVGIKQAVDGEAEQSEIDGLILWSQLSALIASTPSHVSRDGMLSQRHEARAAAAAMWTVRGVGTAAKTGDDPPVPLAIRKVFDASPVRPPEIRQNWGTMMPTVTSNPNFPGHVLPFRPGVASGFLYAPLLSWDFNNLAGAIFSSILLNKPSQLPNSESLLNLAGLLITGRMIQALITPHGFDSWDGMELDEEDAEGSWDPECVVTQGHALARLHAHCQARINSLSLDYDNGLIDGEKVSSPVNLFGSVGRAILPFARSIILMLRACNCAIKNRQKKCGFTLVPSEKDKVLESILDGSETMTTNDGFLVLKEMEGPLPSTLVDESQPWLSLINRWLTSLIVLERHHGSTGNSLLPELTHTEKALPKQKLASSVSGASDGDSNAANLGRASTDQEVEENLSTHFIAAEVEGVGGAQDDPMAIVGIRAEHFFGNRHAVDVHLDSDEDLIEEMEMDEAEEMVDFADQVLGGNIGGANPSSSNDAEDSVDEPSTSGSEDGDGHDSSFVFAGVSQSPIISYQPSVLAKQSIGPGRQGSLFESVAASAVMADLSHLGLIHRKDTHTFSLIRLPKSFVELYGIVNKIKGRDEATALDETDDVGNTETAICLLTGAVMRSGSSRRPFQRAQRPPGACTIHARKTGSGIGIFFLVQKCTVLLMHNNKSAYSPSLYVDEHGEEDPGLRRGRPLFLNDARYRALENLWRQQGIPREVAQIRSTSDRVIRDNWY